MEQITSAEEQARKAARLQELKSVRDKLIASRARLEKTIKNELAIC